MYNVDFLRQFEKIRRDLSISEEINLNQTSEEAHRRYSPPPNMKFLKCKEDTNGEWVPEIFD